MRKKVNSKLENEDFLTSQIITYIGNKRALLDFIGKAVEVVKDELNKEKIVTADLFSGSGIVARYLKQFSSELYVNDLEDYAYTINKCYLSNRDEINEKELNKWFKYLKDNLSDEKLTSGFISELYSPKDDKNIKKGERVFYTTRNANYIDTERQLLDNVPEPYHTLLLAPLLYEASNRTNTSGVFKGFYKNSETNIGQFGGNGKNALHRILSDIEVKKPVLSNFNCISHVYKEDTLLLSETLPKMDLVYLDPPYNQHPYGSNYFMLNLINNYKKPDAISEVSGIPKKWNKSDFNKKSTALSTMEKICSNLNAEYILISFNSEGFISFEDMVKMLSKYGSVRVYDQKYSTFKASRNLRNRSLYVNEYLFLLKKEGDD